MPSDLTAKDLVGFLRRMHPSREWGFLDELRIGTGYGPDAEQRIDAWAIHLWPSKKNLRIAYEVKISRSDFLHELKHPEKRQAALALSNQFFFAVPTRLIHLDEIPPEAGVIEFDVGGRSSVLRPAPLRETSEPTWRFLASIARRADPGLKALEAQAKTERIAASLNDCRLEMGRDLRLGEAFEDLCNEYFANDPALANIHDLPRFLDDNPARTELVDEILRFLLGGLRVRVDLPRRALVLSRMKHKKGLSA